MLLNLKLQDWTIYSYTATFNGFLPNLILTNLNRTSIICINIMLLFPPLTQTLHLKDEFQGIASV